MTTNTTESHWPPGLRFVLFSAANAAAILVLAGCPTGSDDDTSGDDDVADDDAGDDDTQWVQVDVEHHLSCGLRANGRVECWGSKDWGAHLPPADERFVQVASGGVYHACGILESGELRCWGTDDYGQLSLAPEGPQIDIDIDGGSCAVGADNVMYCWHMESGVVEGSFVRVSKGDSHTCGLHTDGFVECWGNNDHGQLDAPPEPFVQVTAGTIQSCGLREDGSVQCWGCGNPHDTAPCAAPKGYTFEQVDADLLSYGITTDHELLCWPPHEQCNPYDRRFLQISVGGFSFHACGLTTDHEILCWGCDPKWDFGECDPPTS